jgi:5-(carboxyamino)imidazole ribonucleotide mutase
MFRYAEEAAGRGLRCIIAGAGGAAHLPGMVAAKTTLPVLGVPVATFAIGAAGAANAGLFAAAMLAVTDAQLAARIAEFRRAQRERVERQTLPEPS